MCVDPKSAKWMMTLTAFGVLLGSTFIKAVRKMLVKSPPCNNKLFQWKYRVYFTTQLIRLEKLLLLVWRHTKQNQVLVHKHLSGSIIFFYRECQFRTFLAQLNLYIKQFIHYNNKNQGFSLIFKLNLSPLTVLYYSWIRTS